MPLKIKVIGVGGVADWLLEPLCLYLTYARADDDPQIHLIDGDEYEERNKERQRFHRVGNKAEVKAEWLERLGHSLYFRPIPRYLDNSNAVRYIREDDIVLLAVDNHATRLLVSERCEELENVVVISGSNDLIDGSLQLFIRRDGKNVTLPLANDFHPEIQNPPDMNPADEGCDVQAQTRPQIVPTNFAAAAAMLGAFHTVMSGRFDNPDLAYDEVFFDITTANSRARRRR